MDATMSRAKKLIQQKRYVEARKVLMQTSDPQSLDWIDKIDGILLKHPEQDRRSYVFPIAVIILVLLIIIGVGVWFKNDAINTNNQRYAQQRPLAEVALTTYCVSATIFGPSHCEDYAERVIIGDPSSTDMIMVCQEVANPVQKPEGFAACLRNSNIPLPY